MFAISGPFLLDRGKRATGLRTWRPGGVNLASDAEFQDFDLHLDFCLDHGANSGVFLRGLYEVQVFDHTSGRWNADQRCGAIFGQIAPSKDAFLGPGTWNSLDVRLVGRKVNVTMNGERVIEDGLITEPTAESTIRTSLSSSRGPSCFNAGVPRPKSDFGTFAFGQSSRRPSPSAKSRPRQSGGFNSSSPFAAKTRFRRVAPAVCTVGRTIRLGQIGQSYPLLRSYLGNAKRSIYWLSGHYQRRKHSCEGQKYRAKIFAWHSGSLTAEVTPLGSAAVVGLVLGRLSVASTLP